MTGKQVLSTRNTHVCIMAHNYLLFYMCYLKSVSFIEFLMDLRIRNDIVDALWITDKKLLHFKLLKLDQILNLDKTGFPRPSHI